MKKNLILFLLIYLVFLYDVVNQKVSLFFSYIDESLLVFLFLLAILRLISREKLYLFSIEIKILIFFICISIIGFLSNIIFKYQSAIIALQDSIIFLKAFVAYFLTRYVFYDFDIFENENKFSKIFVSLFAIILFLLAIQFIYGIFPTSVVKKFGLTEQMLFFVHPSRYAFAITFIFVLLYPRYIKNNKRLLIAVLLLGLFSLKLKFFVFFVLAIYFLFAYEKLTEIKVKRQSIFIAFLLLFILFFFKDKLFYYYSREALELGIARSVLSYFSIPIAINHFPLGAGFGTYGSFISGKSYSPIYYLYDLHKTYGLTSYSPMFVADTYWPMVLGQFGVCGFVLFAGTMYCFFKLFVDLYNQSINENHKAYYIAGIILLTALLIDSTGDQIYSQQRGVVSFFWLALIVNLFHQCSAD